MKNLKRTFAVILIPLFFLFIFVSSSLAQTISAEPRVSKVVTVSADEVINKDFFTAAGEIVEVSGTVNGDVYAAGGQILIDGVVNGDLIAAGGTVNISGSISQDVRVVGGQVTVSGTVGRNLTIIGGDLEITNNANIQGAVLGGGGNVSLLAPIGGDVTIGAGNLTVSNIVDGDFEAYAGNLRLTSKARVNGDLTYMSDATASIDENAVISGKIIKKKPPKVLQQIEVEKSTQKIEQAFAGFKVVATFVGFLSALIVGLLMLRLFPNFLKNTAATVSQKPWASLGIGFLALILVPVVVVILLITIIGLPLGLLLLLIYPVYLYLAKIYVAYWLGLALAKRWAKGMKENWSFILGLAVLYLVGFIPFIGTFIGGVTGFLVLLLGLGASLISDKAFYSTARNKGVI